jgi:hypothetical protein
MADKPEVNRSTTELRVAITEDKDGNLDVEWMCTVKGTEISVPLRLSHVVGMLHTAAMVIALKNYKGLKEKLLKVTEESNSTKRDKE